MTGLVPIRSTHRRYLSICAPRSLYLTIDSLTSFIGSQDQRPIHSLSYKTQPVSYGSRGLHYTKNITAYPSIHDVWYSFPCCIPRSNVYDHLWEQQCPQDRMQDSKKQDYWLQAYVSQGVPFCVTCTTLDKLRLSDDHFFSYNNSTKYLSGQFFHCHPPKIKGVYWLYSWLGHNVLLIVSTKVDMCGFQQGG